MLGQRKRGRPRKVRPGEGETPTTVVAPVVEDSTNPVVLNAVEELDPVTDEVIATYDDPMEPVDLEPWRQHEDQAYLKATFLRPDVVDLDEDISHPSEKFEWEPTPPQIAALDHDHDGQPGGSWPKASLNEHQRNAFVQDIMEAHNGQFEAKRTDQFNRVWTFRHEIVRNHATMLVEAKRGPIVSRQHISTAMMFPDRILQAIGDADRETER